MAESNTTTNATSNTRDNSEAMGNMSLNHGPGSNSSSSFLSKIWEFLTKWLETLYSGIFEDPLFIVNKVIGKKMALSLIYLGLILSLMQVFNPKNNYAMFYLYAICFWIVALILSVWIIDPYDESNIEYALRHDKKTRQRTLLRQINISINI
jgi:archaellum biogenesis protein FlaJ (TadC family)